MNEALSNELEEILEQIDDEYKHTYEYVHGLYTLMCAYESEEQEDKAIEIARKLIDESLIENSQVSDADLRGCYDLLARSGDFEAYCIALEWNRPLRKQFYIPRAKLLKKHGLMQGFQDLNDDKLDLLVLNLPPRIGKLLSNSTPILTKNGWKKHGDLQVGDYVLNNKGRFVKVLATSPEYPCNCRITFANGEQIDCHENHEWLVNDRHKNREIVLETKNMIDKIRDDYGYNKTKNHFRFGLPIIEPILGEYKSLPVEPYCFGVWLGDGTNRKNCITIDKKDNIIAETFNKYYSIHALYIHKTYGTYNYYFNGLRNDLQKINMCYNKKNCIKHIPDMYLTSSVEQRLQLLAGLLDTDGTLSKKEHRYHYSTTEKQLMKDFVSLVSTFGWRCSVTEYEPTLSSSGIQGRKKVYNISFNPTFEIPCRVPRKQLKLFSKQRRITITNIEKIENGEMGKCIQVEGGVYLAGRQLIPTHNSTLSLFFLTFRAGLYPEQSILGNGHSTSLTQSFYREFLEIVTSDEYRFKEIFPRIKITTKNSEYSFIDFNNDKRFHTVMFRSIDAGTTGLAEASNLLYCDDLVKDAETANSKDRLDNLYHTYTSTVKDRKVQRLCKDGEYRTCPELHVNTPWSIYDVTSRIIRTEIEKGNDERTRVISIPCWDENHESNFLYDCGKGFDVKYYEDMEIAEDPVIFSAKYLMKPIEREGRPFEKDALSYYTELPLDNEGNIKTPDRILSYNDVAHGGEDFMSMPIAYIYGYDIYIHDVLFINKFGGDTYSRPLVCEKIINNNVRSAGFEKNNGGDFYSSLIQQDLNRLGYRCNITTYNANTKSSKLDRILSVQNEIKAISTMENSYRVHFRDPSTLPRSCEYRVFLQNIWDWSQKEGVTQRKQHDDGPDSVAGLLINMLGLRSRGSVKLYDIREAGY